MDKLERAQRLHTILQQRRSPLPMSDMQAMFDNCSESTVKRTLRDLKTLGAPIYCTDGIGYSYDKHIAFELPGVWFSPEELHALLTIQQLTANLSGGLFDESMKLIEQKTVALLGENMPSPQEMRRIRILATGSRSKTLPMFSIITSAVLHRQRLFLIYDGRQRGERTKRQVSPQRLIYYRGNWYLDCWCHKAEDLRSFAVERIAQARLLASDCKQISEDELDKKLSKSFGIFSGAPTATAVLCFTEQAARWVADEEWFPDETGRWLDDGTFELRIPYNNPTELIMEICRYAADVEVIEPPELRRLVAEKLQSSVNQYH